MVRPSGHVVSSRRSAVGFQRSAASGQRSAFSDQHSARGKDTFSNTHRSSLAHSQTISSILNCFASCRLPTADCRLLIAACRLLPADCRLPTAESWIIALAEHEPDLQSQGLPTLLNALGRQIDRHQVTWHLAGAVSCLRFWVSNLISKASIPGRIKKITYRNPIKTKAHEGVQHFAGPQYRCEILEKQLTSNRAWAPPPFFFGPF